MKSLSDRDVLAVEILLTRSGLRSFRSMVRSFQVRSFQSIVRSFHKIVSSSHICYIYFLNL